MVGIISGSSLGLFDSSLDVLGTEIGQSGSGQANGKAYTNIATGNLSVQFLDETLSGTGADLFALRTYNSLGGITDGDADGWRWDGEKSVTLTKGAVKQSGSELTRTLGDGSKSIFTWNGSKYVSDAGSGAKDSITLNTGTGQWEYVQDGTGLYKEFYNQVSGWITSSRDSLGNGFDYVFTNNKLMSVTDLLTHQRFEFSYVNNKLSELKTYETYANESTPRLLLTQVTYGYNAAGLLETVKTDLTPADSSITDGKYYQTTYGYDTAKRLTSIQQSDGSLVTCTYYEDGTNKIKTVTDIAGTTTFTYSSTSTTVKNAVGDLWTYTFDATTKLLKKIESTAVNGVKQSSSYTYEATTNNVKTFTDGRGYVTNYIYDGNSNLKQEYDAEGNTIFRTYDPVTNLLLSETRYTSTSTTATLPSTGAETIRYVYDASGNLRFTISAEGRVTQKKYEQNAFGNNVLKSTYEYTGAARYTTSGTPTEANMTAWVAALAADQKNAAQVTEFFYGWLGNLNTTTKYASVNAAGANEGADQTNYTYDAYGNLLQVSVNGKLVKSIGYDGMGRQTLLSTENGTVINTYSGPNITSENTSTGLTTVAWRDPQGLLRRTDSHGTTPQGSAIDRTSYFMYDAAGRLRMSINAMNERTYLFYDAAGRVSFKVDSTGSPTGYTYDQDGRVLTETKFDVLLQTAAWFDGTSVVKTSLTIASAAGTGIDIVANPTSDHKTTYTYDKAGRLKTTTIAGITNQITNTYDGESRLITTTQGSDRVTRYYYDKDGRQTGVLNAEKYLTENIYDGAGRLIKSIRYAGKITTAPTTLTTAKTAVAAATVEAGTDISLSSFYYYDNEGRLLGTVNEQGFLTETIYDPVANTRKTLQYMKFVVPTDASTLSELKTQAGIEFTYPETHIENGQSVTTMRTGTFIDVRTTTTTYDAYGRVTTITTHDGSVSKNYYDAGGRLIRQTQAEGTLDQRGTRWLYNSMGEVTDTVSGVGEASANTSATSFDVNYNSHVEYDGVGRKITESLPGGQKTFYFYNTAGQLASVVNAKGEASRFAYNNFGQIQAVYLYSGLVSTAGITSGGAVSLIEAKLAGVPYDLRVTLYNQAGLVSDKYDGSYFFTNKYNAYGELETVTNTASLGTGTTTTKTEYDLLGRAIKTTKDSLAVAATSSLAYDGYGRVKSATDANLQTTKTGYTNKGRTITVSDPLGRTNSIDVDAYGRTVSSYDGNLKATSYVYNDYSRTLTVTTPEQIQVITTKNRTGETLSVTDGNGILTEYAYTKDGKLDTLKVGGVLQQNNDYDTSGRLFEVFDARGTKTRFNYDSASNLLTKVVDFGGLNLTTAYVFDGQRRQIQVTEGANTSSAVVTKYVFDSRSKIRQIIIDPTTLVDANGNTISNPNGLDLCTTFTYDAAGNTLSVKKGTVASPSQQETYYTFDDAGRKTSESVETGSGRLTTQYKYDKKGNLTRVIDAATPGNSTWFVYDNAGQKTQQIDAMGGVTAYKYDANGKLYFSRQYATLLTPAALASLATQDVVTNVAYPAADNSKDHRSYNVYDNDGRIKYALVAGNDSPANFLVSGWGENAGWVVTENSYDKNGNIIESRVYDRVISEANLSATDARILVTDVVTQLSNLNYSASNLGGTRVINYAYDANNRVRFTTDALGYVTENTYDANGNLTSTRQVYYPLTTAIDKTSVAAMSAAVGQWYPDRTTSYAYDKANRLTITTNAAGVATENVYDALGHVTRVIEHSGAVVQTSVTEINGTLLTATQVSSTQAVASVDVQATDRLKARLTITGDLWVTEVGGGEVKVAENVDSFQMVGTRIGVLKNGVLYVYDGALNASVLTASWIQETYSDWRVNQFQLEGDNSTANGGRIGVMVDGALWVKEGLFGAWTQEWAGNIDSFQLEGNRIAVLLQSGDFIVKEGALNAGWIGESSGVTSFQLEGTRIAVLQDAQLYIKEGGLSTSWQNQGFNVERFQLEGTRIAVLKRGADQIYNGVMRNGDLYVRDAAVGQVNENVAATWGTAIASTVSSFKLSGKRIAYVKIDAAGISSMEVKDDTSGVISFAKTGVSSYALSANFVVGAYGIDDRITSYTYDKAGRQIKTTLAGWYDAIDGRVYATSENQASRFQRTIEVTYDAVGNAVANKLRTGMNDFVYQYKTYDKLGREVYDVDGLGYVSKKTYTALGYVEYEYRYSKPIGVKSTGSWTTNEIDNNIANNIANNSANSGIVEPNYRFIKKGYDVLGRVKSVTQSGDDTFYAVTPDGTYRSRTPTTTNTYDVFGNLTSQTNPNGETSYYYYDKLNHKVLDVDPEGFGTATHYNAFGDVWWVKEYSTPKVGAFSTATRPSYSDGAISAADLLSYGQNRETIFNYNTLGQLTTTYRVMAGSWRLTNTKVYNSFGEIKTSTDASDINAAGSITSMDYDKMGRLLTLVEPKRDVANGTDVFKNRIVDATPTTTFTYDKFGNKTSEVRGAISVVHKYDFAGNEIETIDARGYSSYTGYGVNGKVIRQWQSISIYDVIAYGHAIDKRFSYDKAGRQIASLDYAENYVTGQANTVNAFGEVTQELKVFGNRQDRLSNLLADDNNNAIANTYTYDIIGHLASKKSFDGITSYGYDEAGRLRRITQRAADNDPTLPDRITENTYNKLGQLVSQKLPQFSATLTPNSSATTLAAPAITRDYDRWGNEISESGDTGNLGHKYTYNQDNRLLTDTITSLVLQLDGSSYNNVTLTRSTEYDIQGNAKIVKESAKNLYTGVTVDHITATNTYNLAGQLIATVDATKTASDNSGVSYEYIYDAQGNRVGTKDALGHIFVDRYDKNNNLIQHSILRNGVDQEYTGGSITPTEVALASYAYDQADRRYSESDYVRNVKKSTQYYSLDSLGRLHESVDRIGSQHYYFYDKAGNKTSEIVYPSVGNITLSNSYEYNITTDYASGLVRVVNQYNKDGSIFASTASTYNGFGQLKTETTGTSTTYYRYLENGLLAGQTEKRYFVGSIPIANLKIKDGEYNSIESATGDVWDETHIDFTFDKKGNKTSETNTIFKTYGAYSVDVGVYEPDTSSEVFIGWDWFGNRLYDQVTVPGALIRTDHYTSSGSISPPAITSSVFEYDDQNRLKKVTPGTNDTTTALTSLTYDFDSWGNRLRVAADYKLVDDATPKTKTEWYSYDAMNRVLVEGGVLVNGQVAASGGENGGVVYSYLAGNRLSQESFFKNRTDLYVFVYDDDGEFSHRQGTDFTDYKYTTFTYTDTGLVKEVSNSIRTRNPLKTTLDTPLTTNTFASDSTKYSLANEVNTYDDRGFLINKTQTSATGVGLKNEDGLNRKVVFDYDNSGKLLKQTTKTSADYLDNVITNTYVDDLLQSSKTEYYDKSKNNNYQYHITNQYDYIFTRTGKQVYKITGSTDGSVNPGKTENSYDHHGRLISVSKTQKIGWDATNITYIYNAVGQISLTNSSIYASSKTTNDSTKYYYAPNGGELANVSKSKIDISPLTAIYTSGSTPSGYTVSAGDSLMSIAQALFGDAKLWYQIADANGLQMGPTDTFTSKDIGRNLRIPNTDKNISNTSSNFKPYNSSDIVGDLTPNVQALPPPKAKGCSKIAMIVMIVVAVILTVVTAGAAAMAMGATATATGATGVMALGTSALTGGMVGGALVGTGAVIGTIGATAVAITAAAVGGFVGSIGSQAVGVRMGVLDHIDYKQARGAGLTAGFSAGAGAALAAYGQATGLASMTENGLKANKWGRMAQGAASYAGGYASNRIAGLETEFSWTKLAVASISASVMGGKSSKTFTGAAGTNISNALGGLNLGFSQNFASNFLGNAFSSTLLRLTGRGEKQDWEAMAADAFGNAAASWLVGQMTPQTGGGGGDDLHDQIVADMDKKSAVKLQQSIDEMTLPDLEFDDSEYLDAPPSPTTQEDPHQRSNAACIKNGNNCVPGNFTDEEKAAVRKDINDIAKKFINKPFKTMDDALIKLHESGLVKLAEEKYGIEFWAQIDAKTNTIYNVDTGFDAGFAVGVNDVKSDGDVIWHTHPNGSTAWAGDLKSIMDYHETGKTGNTASWVFASGSKGMSGLQNPNYTNMDNPTHFSAEHFVGTTGKNGYKQYFPNNGNPVIQSGPYHYESAKLTPAQEEERMAKIRELNHMPQPPKPKVKTQ